MHNDYIKEIIDELSAINVILPAQIPDIDLYMDQVTTFSEDKLNGYKRNPEDKILTKTMINNYTKAGLLTPPYKKKYSKNHIIFLIIIYHLKSILSINDINSLLSLTDNTSIEEIYNSFIEIQKNETSSILDEIYKKTQSISENTDDEKKAYLLTVLMLINEANVCKYVAEKIIDKYIPKKQ